VIERELGLAPWTVSVSGGTVFIRKRDDASSGQQNAPREISGRAATELSRLKYTQGWVGALKSGDIQLELYKIRKWGQIVFASNITMMTKGSLLDCPEKKGKGGRRNWPEIKKEKGGTRFLILRQNGLIEGTNGDTTKKAW